MSGLLAPTPTNISRRIALAANLDEILHLMDQDPDNALWDDDGFWIEKIASERQGLVPTWAQDDPRSYYILHTRQVGGVIYELYDDFLGENTVTRPSYSRPVRNMAGGLYGGWAITDDGAVIHRDLTDIYIHWGRVDLPAIAIDISTTTSGHSAVVLCDNSILYILRARGGVIQGPLTLGVGPIVEARVEESNEGLIVSVLATSGTIYQVTSDGEIVVVDKNVTAFPSLRNDLDDLVTKLGIVNVIDDIVNWRRYRTTEHIELDISNRMYAQLDRGTSFVRLDLVQSPQVPLQDNNGPTGADGPTRTLMGASPYSTRMEALRGNPAPLAQDSSIQRSPEDVDDAMSEMEQRIADEGETYENHTGEDYEPDWGLSGDAS